MSQYFSERGELDWSRPGSWDGEMRSGRGEPGSVREPREVRIGDVERDQAVAELSEHFVAGRLTQVEFEERSGQASQARCRGDLVPLFADLPEPSAPVRGHRASAGRPQRFAPPPFFWLAPVLLVGLVTTAVLLTAPWILWFLFALAFFGPHHHRHHQHRHWSHHHR